MNNKKEGLQKRIDVLMTKVAVPEKKNELALLEKQTYDQSFWTDSQNASAVMKKIADLKREIDDIELMQLMIQENEFDELEKLLEKYEVLLFLSGKHDKGGALFSIHAGQGGTEAMDWADILYRMYTRYFERKGFKYEIIDFIAGEEAGIKSVVMQVDGNYVYGYLKGEAGTHRLVRQSPFNAQNLRQTSFALVEVLPIIKEEDVSIQPDDVEWQFFRSGGKGGQNVHGVGPVQGQNPGRATVMTVYLLRQKTCLGSVGLGPVYVFRGFFFLAPKGVIYGHPEGCQNPGVAPCIAVSLIAVNSPHLTVEQISFNAFRRGLHTFVCSRQNSKGKA